MCPLVLGILGVSSIWLGFLQDEVFSNKTCDFCCDWSVSIGGLTMEVGGECGLGGEWGLDWDLRAVQ